MPSCWPACCRAREATPDNTTRRLLAILVTRRGDLYLKPVISEAQGDAAPPSEQVSSAPSHPKGGRGLLAGPNRAAAAEARANLRGSGPRRTAAQQLLLLRLGRRMLMVGEDDRVALPSPAYPFSAVGFLSVGNGTRGCTATLVGRRSLLSAGHCVFDTATRQPYDVGDMAFYPAQHGGQLSSRRVRVAHAMTVYNNAGAPVECAGGRCQRKEDRRYDFSVLTLEEDLGSEFGFLGVGYSCEEREYTVDTAGYPGDLPGAPFNMYGTQGTLAAFSGCEASLASNVISSDLDTSAGQSGSGIWDDEYVIRAVHVAGRGPLHRAVTRWAYEQIRAEVEAHSEPTDP